MKLVKKIVWGLIVIILVVGSVVIGPTMIDWNSYKDDVSQKVKALTGRNLKILGDVKVTVFPAPAIIANDIIFSNMVGAAKTSMIKLQQAEVRIALSPLLVGEIKVETIRLIKPVIELELAIDGKKNWEMKALVPGNKVKKQTDKKVQLPSPSQASVPDVVINDFTIIDGILNYRDTKMGTVERIKGINAHIEAVSLSGPFQSKGALTLHDTALNYEITVGEVIKNRTLPLNLKLGIGQGSVSLGIGGNILDLSGAPKFKGNLRGEGKNLGLLIGAITQKPIPTALAQLFTLEGNISASMQEFEINDLAVQLVDSKIQGDISIEMGDVPRFSVSLSAKQLDLDKFLITQEFEITKEKEGTKKNTRVVVAIPTKQEQTAVKKIDDVIIPENISGSVIISVEALLYRGKEVSDIMISTELKNGLIRLSQFSAQLPGRSEIALFGDLTTPKGVPQFVGNVEATTNGLREIINWLNIEIPNVPADRLHKVDFSSAITFRRDEIKVQSLKLKFDSSKLTGAATIALRSRIGFGANLTLDQINADDYLSRPVKLKALKEKLRPEPVSGKTTDVLQTRKKVQKKPQNNTLYRGASVLAGFDANILLEIKKLGFKGEKLRGVVFDASLYNGSLDIRKFDIAQFAGVTVATSGKIEGLRDIPIANGLHVNVKSKNLSPMMRLLGVKVSFDVNRLGKTSVDFWADGSFLAPKVKSSIKVAGANINTSGKISGLPIHDGFNFKVNLTHPDLVSFIRILGVNYRPVGKIGGLTLKLNLKGNPKNFTFDQMSGKIGRLSFKGFGAVDFSGHLPKITTDIDVAALNLNSFLSATRKANLVRPLWGSLKHQPVVWPGPKTETFKRSVIQIADKGSWSKNIIDLTILKAFDANISLKAPLITVSKYLFKKIDLSAEVRNGSLTTKRLKAQLFGGKLQGNTKIIVDNTNHITSELSMSGMQISEALASVVGEVPAKGVLDANLNLKSSGKSVSGLVASLEGVGRFSMKGVDVSAGVKGSAFSGVYNLLTSLKQLGSNRSGNLTNVDATFQIAQGVARTNDLKLTSQLGNGIAAGTVDLVGWLLNMKGQIQLQENALTQILQTKSKRGISPVGFTLAGPLDTPDVKVDTRALLGGSLPIPGADAILNKAPKKIQRIMKDLFGSSRGESSPVSVPTNGKQPTSPPTQQQEPKKLNAKDLLRGLFK